MNHEPMYMRERSPGRPLLEKAAGEYKKYRKRTSDLPTPIERDYLETIKKHRKS